MVLNYLFSNNVPGGLREKSRREGSIRWGVCWRWSIPRFWGNERKVTWIEVGAQKAHCAGQVPGGGFCRGTCP